MSEEELREKIANIVYISRWENGLSAVLTPKEYQEIEDKLVLLFNELKPK